MSTDNDTVNDDRNDDFDSAFDEFTGVEPIEQQDITDQDQPVEQAENPDAEAEESSEASQATEEGGDEPTWDSVPEPLRKQYEEAQALAARLDHEAKSSNGRVSALQKKINDYEALLADRKDADVPEQNKQEDAWANYKENFPEDAAAIESYFNNRINAVAGRVDEVLTPIQQQEHQRYIDAQQQLLAKDFPAWQSTVQSPAFAEWYQQQPAKVQELYQSTEAKDYAYLLRSFERDTADTKAAETKAQADELAKKRQEKLKTATALPKGQATKIASVPDDFDAAFEYYAAK